MPVVVDEVVITVEVTNLAAGGATTPPPAVEDRRQLVAECVEKVLDILEQKKER